MIEIETDPAMGNRERVEIENGSKHDISERKNCPCVKTLCTLLIVSLLYVYLFVYVFLDINELGVIDNIIRVIVNESNVFDNSSI